MVNRDSNSENAEISRLVGDRKDFVTKPRIDNLPRILKRQTPREDGQIHHPGDGTAVPTTTTTTRGRPQSSVAGPRRDGRTATGSTATETGRTGRRGRVENSRGRTAVQREERRRDGNNGAAHYGRRPPCEQRPSSATFDRQNPATNASATERE